MHAQKPTRPQPEGTYLPSEPATSTPGRASLVTLSFSPILALYNFILRYVKLIISASIAAVAPKEAVPSKRPYALGRRLELSDRKRIKILAAARAQLETNGFLSLTLDALARESEVTRQTIHNLFGTKAGILEALFDQLALDGGMGRMREVMQQSDTEALLAGFVKVFTDFWSKDRLFIRRVHGIAAVDPELGAAVEARNRRRQAAAARVVDRLGGRSSDSDRDDRTRRAATLYAMTSFEFFDALAESCGDVKDTAHLVLSLVRNAVASQP